MSDEYRAFESPADEIIDFLFTKGFGTCRSDGDGGYSVVFAFRTLKDAQKAYRDLCHERLRQMDRHA